MDPLPIPIEEARRRYPCVASAMSNHGLRALARDHPKDWHRLLAAGCPTLDLSPDTTVAEWLDAGAGGRLVPRAATDQWVRKMRGCAQWVCDAVGGTTLAEWDEEELERWANGYSTWALDEGRSGELVGRDLSLLRRALHDGQLALGMKPLVEHDGPTDNKRRGTRAPRRPISALEAVPAMLEALRKRGLAQFVLALIAGCGLWEAQVLRLRVADLDLAGRRIRVHGPVVRGKPGVAADCWVTMPGWVWDLLWVAVPRLATLPMDALLFPNRKDSSRPRSSFRRTFLAAAERAGLAPHAKHGMAIYSPSALRRLGQAVLRNNGAPRMLRGTVAAPAKPTRRERTVERKSREIASEWRVLVQPPATRGWRLRVPRNVAKGVEAGDPEVSWQGRRTRSEGPPLPWSCRGDVPEMPPSSASRSVVGSKVEPLSGDPSPGLAEVTGVSGEGQLAVAVLAAGAGLYLVREWARRS